MTGIKVYQGELVYVAQDNADGTSDVATLTQVATADLTDPAPPVDAKVAADEQAVSDDQAKLAADEAQLAADQGVQGEPQPPAAPGA